MMSAHNCEAPRVIVGNCACIKTGQCEPYFRCRIDATAKTTPKLQRPFSHSNISIVYLSKLNALINFSS